MPSTRGITALYPGTFDPPHLGHLDVIRRAAAHFEQVVVAIAINPEKRPCLSESTRVAVLRELCAEVAHIRITTYHEATVTYAKAQGCSVLIRGLRNAADLDAESGMAQINRSHGIETFFLIADVRHQHLSSRLVKQVLAAGLPLDDLVAPTVARALRSPFGDK
jgi:pantetheine-phosphate adenylyltransferase